MFSHLRNSHRSLHHLIGRTARLAFALVMFLILAASQLGAPSIASAAIPCSTASLIVAIQLGGTIDLPSGCTFNLDLTGGTGPYLNMGINGLPAITTTVIINGNGATITRSASTPFRFFYVGAGGSLTLHNVTLSNGLARGGNGGGSESDFGGGGGGGGMGGNGGTSYRDGGGGGGSIGGNGGDGGINHNFGIGETVTASGGGGGGGSVGGNGGSSGSIGSNDCGGGGGAALNANGSNDTGSYQPTSGGLGAGPGGGAGGAGNPWGNGAAGSNGTAPNGGGGGGGGGAWATINDTFTAYDGGAGGNVPAHSIGGGGGGGGAGYCDEPASGNGGDGGSVDPTSIGGGGGAGTGGSYLNNQGTFGGGGSGGNGGLGSGGGGAAGDSGTHGGNGGFGGGGGGGLGTESHGGTGGFGGGGGGENSSGGFGGADGIGGDGGASGGGGAGLGGAIFVDGTGQLTIDSSTFIGNKALGGDGGMSRSNGSRAGGGGGMGGAIFVNGGSVSIINSTFSGNQAVGGGQDYSAEAGRGYGSVIFAEGGTVTVNNSTLSANSASNSGALYQHDAGSISATSTIIASNAGGNCTGAIGGANNLEFGTSGQCGSGVTQTGDPKLGVLNNNGGLTYTFPLLDSSSAAYQHGSCSVSVTVDQRGMGRKTTCDIGSYEMPPNLTIADVSHNEGDSGTSTMTFTVSLSSALRGGAVSFDIATADGTATTADNDYIAKTLTGQTIPAGQTTYTFDVLVNGDTKNETNETFFVNVTNVSGAIVSDGQGQGTILDDDTPPTLSINNVSQLEGNSGTTDFAFTVSLSNPYKADVTFDIATADGTATTADNDYTAKTLTNQIIPAGQTTYTFDVLVNGDGTAESDETFLVNVTNVSGATINDGQGQGTILDDDTPRLSINDVTQNEGNSDVTNFTFTVSLSAPASGAGVTFSVATASGTALAGSDYASVLLSNVNIPAGQTTYTVNVLVVGDTTVEPDETFFVNVTGVSGAIVADAQGVGTILNDDVPTLSINDVSHNEGNSGTTTFSFTASLSAPSSTDVTFDIATLDGTATTADNDYTAKTLTGQTIPAGQTTYTFDVSVNGDTTQEADETFFVSLSNVSGAPVSDGIGQGTILDDDAPTLSVSDVSQSEGNSGTTTFAFTVSLSSPAGPGGVTFDLATADGTASIYDNDYQANTLTSQTIPAGQTTYTFNVLVNGDTTIEPDETFAVNVSNVSGAKITKGTGTGTIVNDDYPKLSINDVSRLEGDSGATTWRFTVSLSAAAPGPDGVTFDIATADGTATTADNDYVAHSLTGVNHVTMIPGSSFYSFTVDVNGDTTQEPDETFFVNVTNVSGATVTKGTGTGTIQNDDGTTTPNLSINDVSQNEGNSGTPTFAFTVSLSSPAGPSGVTFDIATADGTATWLSGDYTAESLTSQTIPAGQSIYTFNVLVNGDTTVEPDETFTVKVTNVANAVATKGTGTGTILNDDYPTLSISDVSQNEGNTGTTTFAFTVSLSAPAQAGGVSFDITTSDGTAKQPGDYTAESLTSQTIPAGQSSYTFNVSVNGDTTIEPDETFTVKVTNVTNAVATKGTGTGTIKNDDVPPLPNLTINDVSQSEGNAGTTNFAFTVSLSAPAGPGGVSFDIATADNTATSASGDYTAQSLTSQTIPVGQLSYAFTVLVNGDSTVEPDETFFVNVSNVSGATVVDGQGQGTIQNDDVPPPLPNLTINDVSQSEGNAGTTNFTFTVSLSAPAGPGGVSFDIATADNTATSASGDYTAQSLTSQTIPVGQLSYAFTVLVNGDSTVEPDETFFVNVTNASGATVVDGQGLGTIQNDDTPPPLPNLTINDVSQSEGNAGTMNFTFTVSLSAPAGPGGVSFDIATADNTATSASGDYTAQSLTSQTIPVGQLSYAFTVLVNGDTTVEPDETFFVNVSNVSGATVVDGQGLGTIQNDDTPPPLPNLTINDVSQSEGNAGTMNFTFTVSLSAPAASPVTFNIATQDGTATSASGDYTAQSLTSQTIPVGQPSYAFTVLVNGDTTVEPDETFTVNVTNVNGANVTKGTGTGTIKNDDVALPNLSINDVSQNEGNSGTTNFTFTVSLSAPAASPITFNIATQDGTATSASGDYTAKSLTSQSISAGQSSYTFTVLVNGDTTVEPDETFSVNVTTVSGATVSKGTGTGTIKNDDLPPPPVTLAPASLPGGKAGVAYNQTLRASGGVLPYSYSLSGSLPTGLTLNSGVISGTPTATGSFSFSITAHDATGSGGTHIATVSYSIVIAAPTITLSPTKLNSMKVGAAFSQTVIASGGNAPYTWSVSGTLPPGITLDTGTGAISGTPTATGQFTFTITAKDSTTGGTYSASAAYSAKIDPPTVLLNPGSPLPIGTVGTPYNQTVTASGGTAPYNYTLTGSLPAGLSLNSSTGQLSGTPSAAGTFTFSITGKDSTSGPGAPVSASKVYKLVINPAS